jgi:hypothetical protein
MILPDSDIMIDVLRQFPPALQGEFPERAGAQHPYRQLLAPLQALALNALRHGRRQLAKTLTEQPQRQPAHPARLAARLPSSIHSPISPDAFAIGRSS